MFFVILTTLRRCLVKVKGEKKGKAKKIKTAKVGEVTRRKIENSNSKRLGTYPCKAIKS